MAIRATDLVRWEAVRFFGEPTRKRTCCFRPDPASTNGLPSIMIAWACEGPIRGGRRIGFRRPYRPGPVNKLVRRKAPEDLSQIHAPEGQHFGPLAGIHPRRNGDGHRGAMWLVIPQRRRRARSNERCHPVRHPRPVQALSWLCRPQAPVGRRARARSRRHEERWSG